MHGQCGQIGIVAGEHDLVHRGLRGGHFDRGNRMPQALAQGSGKTGLIGIERGGKSAPRPHHVADKLRLFRPDCAEPDRAGIAIQHRGHVDEVDRIVVDDAFALLHQLLDEMAQAKFFSIGHEDAFQSIACSLSGNLSGVIPRGPERRAVTTNAMRQSSAADFRGDHRDCRCGPSGRSGPAL